MYDNCRVLVDLLKSFDDQSNENIAFWQFDAHPLGPDTPSDLYADRTPFFDRCSQKHKMALAFDRFATWARR